MKTDTEIRLEGFKVLSAALGEVEAEKFIALVKREPFDYTKWQKKLWPEKGVADISEAAMQARRLSRKG